LENQRELIDWCCCRVRLGLERCLLRWQLRHRSGLRSLRWRSGQRWLRWHLKSLLLLLLRKRGCSRTVELHDVSGASSVVAAALGAHDRDAQASA
jgi:hypothetical protein